MSQSQPSQNPPEHLYPSQSKLTTVGRAQVCRQGSALRQSRFDQTLKIVEDFIWNIKPPFNMFSLMQANLNVESYQKCQNTYSNVLQSCREIRWYVQPSRDMYDLAYTACWKKRIAQCIQPPNLLLLSPYNITLFLSNFCIIKSGLGLFSK